MKKIINYIKNKIKKNIFTKRILIIFNLFLSINLTAMPSSVKNLFTELSNENPELDASQLYTKFQYESLEGSKSRLWPHLSLSYSANKGEGTGVSTAQLNEGTSSPSEGLGSSSSSVSNSSNVSDGWAANLSLGYFLFTGFAVSEDVNNSERNLKMAKNTESEAFDRKKAELLQLILEYQILSEVKNPIDKASNMMERVIQFSKKKASVLYSKKDRIHLLEKSSAINYHKTKVFYGLDLVISTIKTLLPKMTEKRLKDVPKLSLSYESPSQDQMEQKYIQSSRSHLNSGLDIDNARSYQRVARWKDKFWVPTVYISTGYGYSGNFEGASNDGGVSSGLVLSFNLFDGFYSSARRQQSNISVKMSERKREILKNKKVTYLKYQNMESKVSLAEYQMLEAKSQKKYLRFLDLERKRKQGIGSRLESSLGSLDYVKAKLESLNAYKKHQQALLNIAVDLNEFEKVEINEKN